MDFSERKFGCGSNLVICYNVWLILYGDCDDMLMGSVVSHDDFLAVFTNVE